jgi:hypothetical protein
VHDAAREEIITAENLGETSDESNYFLGIFSRNQLPSFA